MLVSAITARVAETLQDDSNVTWTAAQLIEWINDALRALVSARPDVSVVTASVELTANSTKQVLSAATDLRFIDATRNMGTDGLTPGRTVRLGDKTALDAFVPGWHSETGQAAVKEFMFDEARPREFWVYPRTHATTPMYLEVIKQVMPATITAVGNTLPVDETYAPVLIDWMLWRSFSRDSENTPNAQRAGSHRASFYQQLGIKMPADVSVNPKVREAMEKQA